MLALPARQGRDQALYRAWLVHDLVDAHAWREADRVAEHLIRFADVYGWTARVPRILRRATKLAARSGAPAWVLDTITDAARATDPLS